MRKGIRGGSGLHLQGHDLRRPPSQCYSIPVCCLSSAKRFSRSYLIQTAVCLSDRTGNSRHPLVSTSSVDWDRLSVPVRVENSAWAQGQVASLMYRSVAMDIVKIFHHL